MTLWLARAGKLGEREDFALQNNVVATGWDQMGDLTLLHGRAELDGMIAHLYGLTEEEFAHILSTFPIVKQEVKSAAMEEYRKQ